MLSMTNICSYIIKKPVKFVCGRTSTKGVTSMQEALFLLAAVANIASFMLAVWQEYRRMERKQRRG